MKNKPLCRKPWSPYTIRGTLWVQSPQPAKCYWCQIEMIPPWIATSNTNPRLMTLEHLKRRIDEGKTSLANCVLACRKCNNERNHKVSEKSLDHYE